MVREAREAQKKAEAEVQKYKGECEIECFDVPFSRFLLIPIIPIKKKIITVLCH